MVSLSLCRKTFKLKGNKKSFVPELRSRKCFLMFRDSYVIYIYIYIYIYYEHFMDIMNVLRTGMNMSILHIHVWLYNIYTPSDDGPRGVRKYLGTS